MTPHVHAIDPIALAIGPVSIHWYGVMYLIAFGLAWWLGRLRLRAGRLPVSEKAFGDLLFYGMLGVVIGGCLGEVLFYRPDYYFSHPAEIFMTWHGGMSYHGGFLGVLVAMALWARKRGRNLLDVYDFIAPMVPIGYACGRLGNFINAELPGRLADPNLPWAMLWPGVEGPRHPSPLYQMLVDGVLCFVIVWLFARKPRPRLAVGALYTLLYGCARFFTEYFRVPDWQTTIAGVTLSSGQILSIPMIVAGIIMLAWAYRPEGRRTVTA